MIHLWGVPNSCIRRLYFCAAFRGAFEMRLALIYVYKLNLIYIALDLECTNRPPEPVPLT